MKQYFYTFIFFIFIITLSACKSKQGKNESKTSNKIIIKNSWVRTANKGANSAAYLNIFNGTAHTDTLLTVETNIAKMAGIHQTYHSDDGMTGMKEAGTIVIQPDSNFELEPGGYHLMLMNLKKTLAKGDSVQITLDFAVSGDKKIILPVGKP